MSARIKVTNYQSVREADIKVEGLTLIKGSSNAGKSSFFRAIESAAKNRFRLGCVTFGEEQTDIIIKYDDSEDIFRCTRLATGASPKIRLGNKTKGYRNYDKLNRTVPQEIKDFHNFKTVKTSSDEDLNLNFVSQFTPPLLCNFSPRKVIDLISASEEMTKLFRAKKILDSNNLQLKGSFTTVDTLIAETKDSIHKEILHQKKLPKKITLLEYKQQITDLDIKLSSLERYIDFVTQLENLKGAYTEVCHILHKVGETLEEETKCKQVVRLLTTRIYTQKEKGKLEVISRILTEAQESSLLNDAAGVILTIESKRRSLIDMNNKLGLIKRINKLSSQDDSVIKLAEKRNRFVSLMVSHKSVTGVLIKLKEYETDSLLIHRLSLLANVKEGLQEKKTSLAELKTSIDSNTCPFCGSTYNEEIK